MTTVNVSGTWSEKQRPLNGLSTHASAIHADRTLRVPVVAYVEFHQFAEKLTGNVLTVTIGAIEPATEADGTDPNGYGKQVMDLLDQLRKDRGKGSVDEVPSHSGELAGQLPFDYDGPDDDEPRQVGEVRLTGDGPRVVPEKSGEEIVAEREEAKAKNETPAIATDLMVALKDSFKGKPKTPATDPFTPGDAA